MPEGIGENISPSLYFQSLIHWFLTIHIIYYSYMPLNVHFSEKVPLIPPTRGDTEGAKQQEEINFDKNAF